MDIPTLKTSQSLLKNFHNSSSSIYTNSSSKSDKETSAMSPQQQNMNFSKKDILNALTNQKSSIFLQGTIREMNPIEIANFIKAITGNFAMVMNFSIERQIWSICNE